MLILFALLLGYHPLQCSVDNSWEVANLLILNGATVDHVDDQLWSPLHVACAYESEDMVSLLLENNANTCLLNVDNCFPVDLSNEEGIRDSIFEEMGKLGIGLDEMKQLRQQKATKMLDDLKRAPAGDWNPDSLDETGIAPIHVAAANGYGEVVKYLLKKKSNINLQDKEGYTALHLAVLFNQEKMVRFLLKKGADPRVETCGSETAMSMAEDDVIRQVLANSVTAAVRKEEMLSRFESAVNDEKKVDLKTDMSDLMHREQEPVLINNSKAGSHSGLSVSRDDDDFICNVKPSVYTRSFIRASAMAKLDEMFERETLPDRADLSEQEMVEVTDRVKKSSMKIKGMLKDSFKRKHTTPV
jgi:ankyrin repeat protein